MDCETGMIGFMRLGMAAAAAVGVWSPANAVAQERPTAPAGAQQASALSILTYNVEGLPFPLRKGRAAAAGEIATQLRDMRAAGTQPHVVVLQEAFGAAQREIGRRAGYRYIAFGPDRRLRNDEPMSDEDRAYAADARFLKGEKVGKWQPSGLAILSDYPIVNVRRMAFPAFACAGFDCLANKGAMIATVAVPGATPGATTSVAVVATHMNSKQASGVAPARFAYAYRRQVASIGSFLAANLDPAMPYVFAGDVNIGKSVGRTAELRAMLAGLPRRQADGMVRTALGTCLDDGGGGCTVASPVEARFSHGRNKDWQVYADGEAVRMAPDAISVPFGHDAAGRMLSDHVGYTASYTLAPNAAPEQQDEDVVAGEPAIWRSQ